MIEDKRAKRESGAILLMAVIMLVIVVGFTGAMLALALDESRNAQYRLVRTISDQCADGGTQVATKAVLDALSSFQPAPTSGYTLVAGRGVSWTAQPVGSQWTQTDATGMITTYGQYYLTGVANVDEARSSVHRMILAGITPVFQFAVFYDRDLEILPGAPMTIVGRVHTNRDMYPAPNHGSSLQFQTDYVRSAGFVFRTAKDGRTGYDGALSAWYQGTQTLTNWPLALDHGDPTFAADVQRTFNGTVQTSDSTGVTPLIVPQVAAIGPGGYYDRQAGLTIKDNQAYVNGAAVALPAGTIVEKTMYDGRAGMNVKVTQVDMALLGSSGRFPANGLVYALRTDASPAQPNGIRLANAATLVGPLTLVSPDPVYIQGDYNTAGKQPAAVIADAVNLLSNAWNDTKTRGTLPVAADTTYNLSFVAGSVETVGTQYSGGLENLPRFHESWSGKRATMLGSFTDFWPSQVATAVWPGTGGDHYNAPIRVWSFDADLLVAGKLPPFTPRTARVVQSTYWVDR